MSKVSKETARHYYEHRSEEASEKYRATHVENQHRSREQAEELEDARTDREGAREFKPHGNGLPK